MRNLQGFNSLCPVIVDLFVDGDLSRSHEDLWPAHPLNQAKGLIQIEDAQIYDLVRIEFSTIIVDQVVDLLLVCQDE